MGKEHVLGVIIDTVKTDSIILLLAGYRGIMLWLLLVGRSRIGFRCKERSNYAKTKR